MIALSVETEPWLIALKMLLICTPECAGIWRSWLPRRAPPVKTLNVAETGVSPALNAPAFVRKPAPGPELAICSRNVIGWAAELAAPGMNIPTVAVGAVE
ncbi:MAG: hypothetical protein DMF54_05565 [Acidobacteria bacterium]|nr:MAG: hypothetical protein DMF54_05565 [Acidobacteriota bacterium]